MTPPGSAHSRSARSPLRGQAREEAILAAACELIAEFGYERTTVDQIATRAKASKATMYRRWPGGKAELVADALRRSAEARELTGRDTGSIRGDLLAEVAGITSSSEGEPSLVGLVEGVRDDPMLRTLIRHQLNDATEKMGLAICERARARGEQPAMPTAAPVLHLAIAEVLLHTLLEGSAPGKAAQQRLVDEELLPLINPQGTCP